MGAAVPAFLVIALLGSIVVVVLKRPPDLVVKDSVQFQEALGVWRDVIFTAQPTPRSLKRFQNRIRYIAMRERPIEESQSRWQRVVSDVRRRFSPPAPQPAGAKHATIPESLIVAFAAIDGLQPELLRHLDTKVASGDAGFNSDKFALFETCRKAHQSVFGNWEKMASFLPRYELYVRGIRVN
jgi:hypothetical protein